MLEPEQMPDDGDRCTAHQSMDRKQGHRATRRLIRGRRDKTRFANDRSRYPERAQVEEEQDTEAPELLRGRYACHGHVDQKIGKAVRTLARQRPGEPPPSTWSLISRQRVHAVALGQRTLDITRGRELQGVTPAGPAWIRSRPTANSVRKMTRIRKASPSVPVHPIEAHLVADRI